MDNEKKPATEESRKALYDKMGDIINGVSPILKQWILTQRELDLSNERHKIFDALLSLSIVSCYFSIELASVLRSCFRANLPAEKRYNIKYINCVINEAYKYLYGFDDPKKQTQKRSAFWKKKIVDVLMEVDDTDLHRDLCSIENSIIALFNDDIADRDQRNLSFHYDEDPLRVYNMLIGLSEEDECQRMIRFMGLLDEISKFVAKWMKKYVIAIDIKPDDLFSLCDVDFFRNSKEKLLAAMGSAIETHSNGLDDAVKRQGLPDRLRQLVDDSNDQIAVVDQIVELERAVMQLQFIYIDLASASTAYLTAEHTMEKQLSLKQIIIIIYEGFNKIYGLNNEGARNSFWTRLIAPIIVELQEKQLYSKFEALTMELEGLKSEVKKLNEQRQLFVHYDRGIIPVYDELYNLNPLLVFMQTHDIVKFLSKILNFFTQCLHAIDKKREADRPRKKNGSHIRGY